MDYINPNERVFTYFAQRNALDNLEGVPSCGDGERVSTNLETVLQVLR